MTDADDLTAYLQELEYLRTMGSAFASRYPRVAGALELGEDGSADPHVERLIESFAFLTARLQRELDAQFPRIPEALLGVLYPHLGAPIPSMAIARFEPDPQQSRALPGFTIAAATPLFATATDGTTCRFRTAYPVTLWPVEVVGADLIHPADIPALDTVSGLDAASVLRLRLACLGRRTFAEFHPAVLRFFLHGAMTITASVYELLFNQLTAVAVLRGDPSSPAGDGTAAVPEPALLPPDCIRPVGFGADEAVLPHPEHAHQGYRLLQEYFTFPDKYLFFDLHLGDLAGRGGLGTGRVAEVLFLLAEAPRRRLAVGAETFRLNCTPIVNLFPKTTEPIRLDHTRVEYRLQPDSRWERSTEIHSVARVSATSRFEDDSRLIRPFFSFTHDDAERGQTAYWLARRTPTCRPDQTGTDIHLSFVDLDFQPSRPPTQVVFAQTLCTNRGLADQLPAGTDLAIELDAPIRWAACLTKPTLQHAPALAGDTLWRLVSHLSLNHLSLEGGPDSLAALQEVLRLYAGPTSAASANQIKGLTGLATRRVVRHVGEDAWRSFCRGIEIRLDVDESLYVGASAFLLSAVLNRFFGLYAGVNTFTQLVVGSRQRDGIWKTWPPLAGEAIVL
ncbi:MAG: type VI secretion system baseplate subunit TssF [Rhodospirillales bacterium]|nr:MAG: type VI secretion system baseplate subunit TssF [Rhodospirillales bacterium]